jgi:hypothetical protein
MQCTRGARARRTLIACSTHTSPVPGAVRAFQNTSIKQSNNARRGAYVVSRVDPVAVEPQRNEGVDDREEQLPPTRRVSLRWTSLVPPLVLSGHAAWRRRTREQHTQQGRSIRTASHTHGSRCTGFRSGPSNASMRLMAPIESIVFLRKKQGASKVVTNGAPARRSAAARQTPVARRTRGP